LLSALVAELAAGGVGRARPVLAGLVLAGLVLAGLVLAGPVLAGPVLVRAERGRAAAVSSARCAPSS